MDRYDDEDEYADEDEWGVLDKRDLAQSLDHWVDHINAEQLRNAMVELGYNPPRRPKGDLVDYTVRRLRVRRLSVDELLHHLPYTRIRLLAFVLGLNPRLPIPELRRRIASDVGQRFFRSSSDGKR